MAGQDDALYQQAQQLFDRGDRAGAQAIVNDLRSRNYAPSATPAPVAAPAAAPAAAPNMGGMNPAHSMVLTPPAPAAPAAPAIPDMVRNAGDAAMREYQRGQQFTAAGNHAEARLSAARTSGLVAANQMLTSVTGGRGEAALLSFAPQAITDMLGRALTKPQGMSDAEFNAYSSALHGELERQRPASSVAGGLAQAVAVPEVGLEGLAARAGARGALRLGARVAENASVGAALGAANEGPEGAGSGAVYGALGGEAGRLIGHAASMGARALFPGRSTGAYRVIARALGDQQIGQQELDQVANRIQQATGRRPNPLEVLSDPQFGERGARAIQAIQGIARGNEQAATTLNYASSEAQRAQRERAANNPHPATSAASDTAFGAVANNPVDAQDAADLLAHRDIGGFIRPRAGEVGMVGSQTDRFGLANTVAIARRQLTTATAANNPAAITNATRALQAAEHAYNANPVTVNDIDALRQIVGRQVQTTGNTRIAESLQNTIRDVGDRATGGQYRANIAQHAAGAQAEEAANSRATEAMRGAAAGQSGDAGAAITSHAAAGAAHAVNGSPTGALYHLSRAVNGIGKGVNAPEARALVRQVVTPGTAGDLGAGVERGAALNRGVLPGGADGRSIVSTVGAVAAHAGPAGQHPGTDATQAPSNDDLYNQAQQMFDNGDRAGAQRIVDQLKAKNYVPHSQPSEQPAAAAGAPASDAEDLIQAREGFRPTAYNDAGGHPTIGFGHKIEPGEDFSGGLTEAQATDLMRRDIQRTAAPLDHLITDLSPRQRQALTSFGYNAGPGALQRVVDAINSGNGSMANATRIMAGYTTSGGRHVPALAARRRMEIAGLLASNGGGSPDVS